jgi:hypothetical protein
MKKYNFWLAALCAGCWIAPAHAQYTNPYTGRTFNNPTSSLIDTMILNNQRAMMLRNSLMASNLSSSALAAAYKRTVRTGALKIKKGQATTRFTTAPFPLDAWMKRWGAKTPEDRRRLSEEYAAQKAIWQQEAKARGTNTSDMAESLALAFVLAYEVHSGGEKVGEKPYQWVVGDFKRVLMKDAYFQGMSAAEKQYLQESAFLNSTDPVRLWRQGKPKNDAAMVAKARQEAKAHLTRWWDEPVDKLRATPDRFTTHP